VPSPGHEGPQFFDALAPDLSGENRSEPMAPEPDRLVAHIDPALTQQVVDIPEREREPDLHRDREADDLG